MVHSIKTRSENKPGYTASLAGIREISTPKFHIIEKMIESALTPELIKPGFGPKAHCYIASEAAYHLLGGKEAGLKPMNVKHENIQHWFLTGPNGIIDLTANQFETPVPYDNARGRGFLTKSLQNALRLSSAGL